MADTKLIVISQVISMAFLRWIEAFADKYGPVDLWTGVDFAVPSEVLQVRRFIPYDKTSHRTRLLAWIRFSVSVMLALVARPRHIPVLAITNPPFMPLILVLHSIIFGRRYGIIEYDIYPQIMVTMGLMTARNVSYRTWGKWHAWALRRSNVIITLSDLMADELSVMANEELTHLFVIPTWTDTTQIKPLQKTLNPFVREHLSDADIVIIYSGNIGATHAIETIIEVAENLKYRPQFQFLIVGNGAKYEQVESAIVSGRTPNIKLLPLQPVEVLPYSLASADIAFVTLASGYERLSLPSKTYDMMAAGCAIVGISQSGSGLDRLISRHDCGRNFEPDQVESIASWIVELCDDRNRINKLKQNARQAAVKHYSEERCSLALTDTILAQLWL